MFTQTTASTASSCSFRTENSTVNVRTAAREFTMLVSSDSDLYCTRVWLPSNYLRQGSNVLPGVCLCVCLFVCLSLIGTSRISY